jgi:hypothetical protein
VLARAFDREALIVEQFLDAQEHLDVLAPVQAVLRARLARTHHAELGLPVAQDVRLHAYDLRDLTDLEVQLAERNLTCLRTVRMCLRRHRPHLPRSFAPDTRLTTRG